VDAVDLAAVGALIGHPSRTAMLDALLGGRAMTATELRPHVSHTFDWTEVDQAKQVQQEQRHIGKITLAIP